MVYTDTMIANLALYKLGEIAISGLSEQTKAGKLCNDLFAHTRNLILQMPNRDWSAVIKRNASLTREVTPPVSGYRYYYTLPTDCLHVLEMVGSSLSYRIEAGKLLTDAETCSIVYIFEPSSYATFGSHLVELIAAKLASNLAMPLSKSPNLKKIADLDFEVALLRASWADVSQRQEKDRPADLWINAQEADITDEL